ncbi:MAG: hypothetical protein KDB22_29355 [Planctomycetales bacterium]|nr:hypothetical protein [Planctomycetales bacterium]
MMHLIATAIGVAAFISCFSFLVNQTNDLEIFPNEKRYLGAALCLIACVNVHALAYKLVRGVISALGLLARSDVDIDTLSPLMDRWPDEWYEKITKIPPHPLDKAG